MSVLILIVFGIWRVTAGDAATAPSLPRVAVEVALLAVALLVLSGVGAAIWGRSKGAQLLARGTEKAIRGELLAARACFAEGESVLPRWPSWAVHLGHVDLALWRVPEALADYQRGWARLLDEQAKRPAQANRQAFQELKASVPQWLALATALSGDAKASLEWLGKAGDLLANVPATLARAVNACRAGDFATAVRELAGFENIARGGYVAVLGMTLQAWALEQTTGEQLGVHRGLLFVECQPADLARVWPELAAFVERAPLR
ncbi:MAG: hypothetical protein QM723_40720 [Myxococcaceae bacterium]